MPKSVLLVPDKKPTNNFTIDLYPISANSPFFLGTLFLKAYAFLLSESNFPVDLKPWELLDEHIRKKVEEEGVVLARNGYLFLDLMRAFTSLATLV